MNATSPPTGLLIIAGVVAGVALAAAPLIAPIASAVSRLEAFWAGATSLL